MTRELESHDPIYGHVDCGTRRRNLDLATSDILAWPRHTSFPYSNEIQGQTRNRKFKKCLNKPHDNLSVYENGIGGVDGHVSREAAAGRAYTVSTLCLRVWCHPDRWPQSRPGREARGGEQTVTVRRGHFNPTDFCYADPHHRTPARQLAHF